MKLLALLLSLLTALPAQAAGPLIWSGGGRAKGINQYGITTGQAQTLDFDGPENWIKNGGAEDPTITGIALYNDSAAAPVDCTGGTTTGGTLSTTTTAMRGNASYTFAKDAADRQGVGVAIDVTLPADNPAATAGWLAAFSAYLKTSAAYVADDIGIWAYDVTNATTPVLITNVAASTQSYSDVWGWSASGSSASYRICIHIQTTNASAYTLTFDRLYAGIELGQPVPTVPSEPWTPFTPSWSAGTPATSVNTGAWRRDADTIEIIALFTASGAGTTEVEMTLPNSLHINAAITGTATSAQNLGEATFNDAGVAVVPLNIREGNTTAGIIFIKEITGAADTIDGAEFGSGDQFGIHAFIPIAEWANPSYSANAGNCEYAYTTEAWDAAGSTTAFGAGGTLMGGALSTARAKTVTFRNPVKVYDIQMSRDGIAWQSAIGANLSTGIVIPSLSTTGTSGTSGGVYKSSPSTYQVTATFFRYMSIANDDSPTADWPSTDYWRIENCPTASGSITFADATSSAKGLVSAEEQGSVSTLIDILHAVDPTVTIQYSRVGKSVTLTMNDPPANANKDTTASPVTVTALPASLRPSAETWFSVRVRNNAGDVTGYMTLGTDGIITWFVSSGSTSWTTGQSANVKPFGVSYVVP